MVTPIDSDFFHFCWILYLVIGLPGRGDGYRHPRHQYFFLNRREDTGDEVRLRRSFLVLRYRLFIHTLCFGASGKEGRKTTVRHCTTKEFLS